MRPRTNLNRGILTAAIILSHSTVSLNWQLLTYVFNSHVQVFFRYEPPAAASRQELSQTERNLAYKPSIGHAEKHRLLLLLTSRVAVWRYCGEAYVTRTLPTLAQSKHLQLSRGAAQHGTAELARHGENTASCIVA
jgi:hypothetical protein